MNGRQKMITQEARLFLLILVLLSIIVYVIQFNLCLAINPNQLESS